jgi:hypothetical protein
MDISNLDAKDVLEESGLDEYRAGMNFFYSELVELNVIVYLAEQIVDFPFELFAHPDKTIFFSMVMHSFHNSAILIVTRLAADQKGDLYTLSRFKNRVLELTKPEFKDSVKTRLREVRFDQVISDLLEKARELRSNRIAHTTQDLISENIKASRPTLYEITKLRDALNSLLDATSFNVSHMMLPIPYAPNVLRSPNIEHKTDIEELLECVLRNSNLLNMPERFPERWNRRREHWVKKR